MKEPNWERWMEHPKGEQSESERGVMKEPAKEPVKVEMKEQMREYLKGFVKEQMKEQLKGRWMGVVKELGLAPV